MKFTFASYKLLLSLLRSNGYQFTNYHAYKACSMPVIMRHDVDNSLEKALHFAELEYEQGVQSTYFVLVTSDFYNVFSGKNKAILRQILDMGHEIGLHFDETVYSELRDISMIEAILHEREILKNAIQCTEGGGKCCVHAQTFKMGA